MRFLKTILLVAMMAMTATHASAALTLEECQRLATNNYPLLKKYDLINQTTNYTLKNIERGYLPQLALSGQASYQSAVSGFPDVMLDLLEGYGYSYEGLKKDQYKVQLDISQVIWDGGNLKAQKETTKAEGKVQTAQTDIDMYAIRERVNELFFGILLLEEQIQLNDDLQKLLGDNCRKLESRLANGTAMKSDVDVMKAELLKAQQDMTSLLSMKKSYRQMLAIFIGKEESSVSDLQKPVAYMPKSLTSHRPELDLFTAQMEETDAQLKLLNTNIRPQLSLFAQGYYGYPGYDMFSDMRKREFSLNGIIGIKVTWNIGNFYTHKNDIRKLELAKKQVETTQEVFLFNTELETTQERQTIEQYRQMMIDDNRIIELRTNVRRAAEAKLEHGVIDVNDLLQEISRENQARLGYSSHEVEMLRNIYALRNTINQ